MADQPGSHFKKETTQLCPDEEVNFENKIDPLNCSMVAYEIEQLKSNILCNLPWLMVMFVMH